MADNYIAIRFFSTTLLFLCIFTTSICQEDELRALLQLKKQLNDPLNHLISWKESSSPCHFYGISCNSTSGKVTGISLTSKNLSGELSPSISALRSLASLDLSENSISGSVPYDLQNCTRLQVLNLSSNNFNGHLPELSSLQDLQILDISSNSFSGSFPAWIGNLTSLVSLGLAINKFDEEEIPESIGKLKNLKLLYLADCNLVGEIPNSVFELTSLEILDLSQNQITGEFPKAIANLRNLSMIELYQNRLKGEIPPELASLPGLREFDISQNQMSGSLPREIGSLKNLSVFHLFHNNFSGEIPAGFGEMQFLVSFSVYENSFSGEFPANFGRLSPLNSIDISENYFSGNFPQFLCQNNSLRFLLALENNFSGDFPGTYQGCKSLLRFRISRNSFVGMIPPGIWGLPSAVIIDVADNGFVGDVTEDIMIARSLNQLFLNNNKFSGEILEGHGNFSQPYASNNFFSGRIPPEIGYLKRLTSLHLEDNLFAGPIPSELGTCSNLVEINLARNSIFGDVPSTLSMLSNLNTLNLSQNQLTGPIPEGLQTLKLSSVDFSENNFTGTVPPGLVTIGGKEAFSGNRWLSIGEENSGICCGNRRQNHKVSKRMLLLALVTVLLGIVVAGLVFKTYKSLRFKDFNKEKKVEEAKEKDTNWQMERFHPTELEADEICCLEEGKLIGSGGIGGVYRVELKNKVTVAVKQTLKGSAEIDLLGKIKHKNILRLHACLKRGESKFLVFDYMPKGNLYEALRRRNKDGNPELDWRRRHKIALGAAKAIEYLHHGCSPPIIHRDVKSTNILLDEEYEAKIADLGNADTARGTDLSCLSGTQYYVAPEMAYSFKVSEKSDVYSFGVVLLELLTGRGPTEPQFGEGKDIVHWVSTQLDGRNFVEILDSGVSENAMDDMVKVLKVAMLCTTKLPSVRPYMREVVNMLIDADPCREANGIKL